MAKKNKEKINLKTVSPLQAVTIGEIKENKYGWVGIIFLFALFAGIVFYLPDIFEMYEQYTSKPVSNAINMGNTINNTTTNPKDDDDDTTNYTFLEKTGFKFENIDIQDIAYIDGTLSYKIKNKTEQSIILENLNLFFELYDSKDNIIMSYHISGFLDAKATESFSNEVSDDVKDKVASYNIIEEIIDDSIPELDGSDSSSQNNDEDNNPQA